MRRTEYNHRLYFLLLLFIGLTLSNCDKECPPPPVPPEDINFKIEIDVNKIFWTPGGAVGMVNGELKDYDHGQISSSGNGLYGIQIIDLEWYQNKIWASREIITLSNLDLKNYQQDDTIFLDRQAFDNSEDPHAAIFHLYDEGISVEECYEMEEDPSERSWLRIQFLDAEVNYVYAELNLSVLISDACASKYDVSQPDKIKIENLMFGAVPNG